MSAGRNSHRSLSGCPKAAASKAAAREVKYQNGLLFRQKLHSAGCFSYNRLRKPPFSPSVSLAVLNYQQLNEYRAPLLNQIPQQNRSLSPVDRRSAVEEPQNLKTTERRDFDNQPTASAEDKTVIKTEKPDFDSEPVTGNRDAMLDSSSSYGRDADYRYGHHQQPQTQSQQQHQQYTNSHMNNSALGYDFGGYPNRSYDQGAFERFDPAYASSTRYGPYGAVQPLMDDYSSPAAMGFQQPPQGQTTSLGLAEAAPPALKVEMDDTSSSTGPICPRPVYQQYEPSNSSNPGSTGGTVTQSTIPAQPRPIGKSGFSAINLSVKTVPDTITEGGTTNQTSRSPIPGERAPVMDLSTGNISSSGRQSPRSADNQIVSASQISSPQTLDLSVNRISNK